MPSLKAYMATALTAASLAMMISFVAVGTGKAQDKGETAHGPTPSPSGAQVYFIDLKDGTTVPQKFVVHFGLKKMGVAPAGTDKANTGHHHLLIDTELPPLDKPIPNDKTHRHYGAGQTEAEIELPPGEHTLQLVLGDKSHIPFNPPVVSDRIKITVK